MRCSIMVNRTLCDFFEWKGGRHPIVHSSPYYFLWKFSVICWNRVIATPVDSALDKGKYNEIHVFLQRYARGFFITSPLRGWYSDLLWPTHVIVYFYYVNNVNIPTQLRLNPNYLASLKWFVYSYYVLYAQLLQR